MTRKKLPVTPPGLLPEGVNLHDFTWLILMSSILFLALFPISSYVATLPKIQEEWALNNTEAGTIFSATFAGFAISALFLLPMSDRFGSKIILIISALISAISQILFPFFAEGIITAVILRFISGVGLVGVYNTGMRIVAERFSTSGRGMAVGTYVTFFYTASGISLLLTGILMSYMEWRTAYLIMATISSGSLPLALVLLRSYKYTSSGKSRGTLNLSVLKNKSARIFMAGYTLHSAELYIVRVWLPAFLVATLVHKGTPVAEAAITAATIGGLALGAGALGPVIGGILSDKYGRALSAAAIFGLSGLVSFTIGWTIELPMPIIIFLSVVYGWAIAADSAIYSTAVTEVSQKQHLGSALAVHSFMGFTGGVIGPILIGSVLDLSGESIKWVVAFTATGLLSVIAISILSRARYRMLVH